MLTDPGNPDSWDSWPVSHKVLSWIPPEQKRKLENRSCCRYDQHVSSPSSELFMLNVCDSLLKQTFQIPWPEGCRKSNWARSVRLRGTSQIYSSVVLYCNSSNAELISIYAPPEAERTRATNLKGHPVRLPALSCVNALSWCNALWMETQVSVWTTQTWSTPDARHSTLRKKWPRVAWKRRWTWTEPTCLCAS